MSIENPLSTIRRMIFGGSGEEGGGVMVLDLVPDNTVQLSLFMAAVDGKKKKMLQALDQVNKNFGKDTLRFAVQGYQKEYRLKSAHLSKHYTTDINEVLEIGR